MTTGYLGPKGTFTYQAAGLLVPGSERQPYYAIDDVLKAAITGEIQYGVVPIENSTEGFVNATLDSLIFDREGLYIKKELFLPVSHSIMALSGTKKEEIKRILSHPQALAQCRKYLNTYFKDVPLIPSASTAEAARLVAEGGVGDAAIAIEPAAEIYGLSVIDKEIQDQKFNHTRFILLSKEDTSLPKAGSKTSIAFSTANKPGELYKILDIFSLWDINMTAIISRPMRNCPGEYVFFVDIEGYDENDAKDALKMIRRKAKLFKNLGTYIQS